MNQTNHIQVKESDAHGVTYKQGCIFTHLEKEDVGDIELPHVLFIAKLDRLSENLRMCEFAWDCVC